MNKKNKYLKKKNVHVAFKVTCPRLNLHAQGMWAMQYFDPCLRITKNRWASDGQVHVVLCRTDIRWPRSCLKMDPYAPWQQFYIFLWKIWWNKCLSILTVNLLIFGPRNVCLSRGLTSLIRFWNVLKVWHLTLWARPIFQW